MVAFNAEQDRELPHGRHVDRFVEVAFAGGPVAGEDQGGLPAAPQFGSEGNAVCNAQLRPDGATSEGDWEIIPTMWWAMAFGKWPCR